MDGPGALSAYEALRLGPTSRIVETNRTMPPDFRQHQGRRTQRRQAVPAHRRPDQPGRTAPDVAGIQAHCRLRTGTAACGSGTRIKSGVTATPSIQITRLAVGRRVLLDRTILHRHWTAAKCVLKPIRASAWSRRCIIPCISLVRAPSWKLRGSAPRRPLFVEAQAQAAVGQRRGVDVRSPAAAPRPAAVAPWLRLIEASRSPPA